MSLLVGDHCIERCSDDAGQFLLTCKTGGDLSIGLSDLGVNIIEPCAECLDR